MAEIRIEAHEPEGAPVGLGSCTVRGSSLAPGLLGPQGLDLVAKPSVLLFEPVETLDQAFKRIGASRARREAIGRREDETQHENPALPPGRGGAMPGPLSARTRKAGPSCRMLSASSSQFHSRRRLGRRAVTGINSRASSPPVMSSVRPWVRIPRRGHETDVEGEEQPHGLQPGRHPESSTSACAKAGVAPRGSIEDEVLRVPVFASRIAGRSTGALPGPGSTSHYGRCCEYFQWMKKVEALRGNEIGEFLHPFGILPGELIAFGTEYYQGRAQRGCGAGRW